MSTVVLIVLIASSMILGSTQASEAYQNVALQVHNKYRAAHHADDLSMDGRLNDLAVQCAKYYLSIGKIDHTCPLVDKYRDGENLYYSFEVQLDNSAHAEKATTLWYDEYKKYKFKKPGFYLDTGHFTQMVWKESKKFGFGVARGNGKVYAVASYSPPGNFPDRFARNVVPSPSKSSRMAPISSYKYFIIYPATVVIYYALSIA